MFVRRAGPLSAGDDRAAFAQVADERAALAYEHSSNLQALTLAA